MKLALMKSFLLFITGGGVAAITLFPFGIYFKKQSYLDNPRIRNHEKIHWKQQIEMFVAGIIIAALTAGILMLFSIFSWWMLTLLLFPFLFFYIEYAIEWFIKVILPPQGAYYDLSTEREAHEFDDNLSYLDIRKHFAWLKYIFKAP
jgi:hypothetical protein